MFFPGVFERLKDGSTDLSRRGEEMNLVYEILVQCALD
jgi:hypothetical protein